MQCKRDWPDCLLHHEEWSAQRHGSSHSCPPQCQHRRGSHVLVCSLQNSACTLSHVMTHHRTVRRPTSHPHEYSPVPLSPMRMHVQEACQWGECKYKSVIDETMFHLVQTHSFRLEVLKTSKLVQWAEPSLPAWPVWASFEQVALLAGQSYSWLRLLCVCVCVCARVCEAAFFMQFDMSLLFNMLLYLNPQNV